MRVVVVCPQQRTGDSVQGGGVGSQRLGMSAVPLDLRPERQQRVGGRDRDCVAVAGVRCFADGGVRCFADGALEQSVYSHHAAVLVDGGQVKAVQQMHLWGSKTWSAA
jgi:hypothetical protein